MSGTIQDILNFLRGAPAEQAEPVAAETAPLTTESPRAPVVTNAGAATARPPADNSPFTIPPESQSALDRLASFGAAMASTRSPTFQGAFGEGVQALLRQGAAQRQEARQQQQIDVEQEYRRAQESRQRAELDWSRDPQNPLNIARLAQARADEIRARAALVSAGRENLGQGTPIELEGGRQGLLMRDGSVRELPGGARFLRSAEQADRAADRSDARRLQAQAQAAAELRDNPLTAGLPLAEKRRLIDERAEQVYNYLSRPSRPAAPTEGAAPATPPNIERMQYRAPGS